MFGSASTCPSLSSWQRLVEVVRDVLESSALPAKRLELEITESLLADDAYTRSVLGELRELGVSLALDDFGTGLVHLGCYANCPSTA